MKLGELLAVMDRNLRVLIDDVNGEYNPIEENGTAGEVLKRLSESDSEALEFTVKRVCMGGIDLTGENAADYENCRLEISYEFCVVIEVDYAEGNQIQVRR